MNSAKMWTRLRTLGSYNVRGVAITSTRHKQHCCRVLVLGGGSAGCTMAARFCKQLGKDNVIVVEPSGEHYYQPMFTLIGGGVKKLSDSVRPMEKVLPAAATWLRDEVEYFDPLNNSVCTKGGDQIEYEFLIVAMGIKLHYDKIPGVEEALKDTCSGVCSIYSPQLVEGVFKTFEDFNGGGNAIFTQPPNHIKCAGAPQKIAYLFEHYLRRKCQLNGVNIIYNTALPVIFSSKYYADALWKVANKRNITVNLNRNLVEVRPQENIAVFADVVKPDSRHECEYKLLHVTPPQSPPKALRESKAAEMVDSEGYLAVCPDTLRHVKYKNIYGIGDCCNVPTSKTMAAVAAQNAVVSRQITAQMCGKPQGDPYDGYTACPLLTGYDTGILAEFDYTKEPLETLPFRQDREFALFYPIYNNVLPFIYWDLFLKGNWDGVKALRQLFHPSGSKKKK